MTILKVYQGGSGANTLTGVLIGTGTAPFTAIPLSGNALQYLDGSGVFSVPAGGGGGLILQVDGTPNGDQTLLNLISGTNITLTDDGLGGVTIDAVGGGTLTTLTADAGGTTTGTPVTLTGSGGITTTRALDVITIDGSGVTGTMPSPINDVAGGVGGVVSIDYVNRQLFNSAGSLIIDYNNDIIYDNATVQSIHWVNRTLLTSGGVLSMNWDTRRLHVNGPTVGLDYSDSGLGTAWLNLENTGARFTLGIIAPSMVVAGLSYPIVDGAAGEFITTDGAGNLSFAAAGAGTVTSVSGTANRITSTGGATPVIDISATFEALLGKVASPLSQFAATTSAQLAGVISDETGTGALVFGTSPDFTTGASIGGVALPTISSTDTLTNKRITKRVLALSANSATPAINTDNFDVVHITAQTAAITSFTTNLTGTPVDGDSLRISVTGTGAVALTFGASFQASTVALPTTTVGTARLDMGFLWNSEVNLWRIVAVA